jgi:hypothetical protein
MLGDSSPCPNVPLGSRTVTRRCSQPSELANARRNTAQLGFGRTPWGAFLQEHIENHPMAHLGEPAIEVCLEPQLPEAVPFGSKSDLK